MNPTLSQQIIDDAMAEDPAARAEYLAKWRTDVSAFISRELVEALVLRGGSLLPVSQTLSGRPVKVHLNGFAMVSLK